MTALSDEEVVQRVVAGEPALFELLVRRHNQKIYRTARAIVKNEAEAEDVMQQAYIAAYQHLAEFKGDAQVSTWLVRIAVNEALGRLRKAKKLSLVDDESVWESLMSQSTPPPSPEQQASTHELSQVLEAMVDTLPEIYRLVFTLREIEEMSTAETAAALGVSEDVVKQRLHRAKALIDDQLRKRTLAEAKTAFAFEAPRCNRITAAVMAKVLGH
jgi:RNA polymerase sigma-70 factor (ECF subfamily)